MRIFVILYSCLHIAPGVAAFSNKENSQRWTRRLVALVVIIDALVLLIAFLF
jgi:hypothetical protein